MHNVQDYGGIIYNQAILRVIYEGLHITHTCMAVSFH